jgi:hypothetical protein
LERQISEAQRRLSLIAALEAQFPGAVFQNDAYGTVEYVRFAVPGAMQYLTWIPGSKFVGVAPIDREAWERYEDRLLAPVRDWENEGGAAA